MTRQKMVELRDGTLLPAFGLGTWLSKPGEVYDAVRAAIDVGYRHIDCAAIYGNEGEVGRAIADAISQGTVAREDLWITSKLWNDSHEPRFVRGAIDKTRSDLKLDRLDLYLIHWPIAFRHGVQFPKTRAEFLTLDEAPLEATWEAMLELKAAGVTRQVGVSNMGPARLEKLASVGEAPAMDQVECHPHLQQTELLDYGRQHDIRITCYSPLGSPGRQHRAGDEPPLLKHPTIEAIAEELGASCAQVLIAWALARETVVIPKSVNPSRIAQNYGSLDVELTPQHMQTIAQLDKGYRYLDGEFFAGEHSPYTAAEIFA